MINPNQIHSAYQLTQEAEKERIEQELIRKEKEHERQEREFDRKVSLEMLNELKAQNAQLKKEYEESQIELKKSRKYNWIMLIISLVSVAIAIASFVVAIAK